MKTKINAGLIIIAVVTVSLAIASMPRSAKAYSYSGLKWSSYPISVNVSDTSFPSSWSSPVANAMSAWNAASSPFYFNIGYSNYTITLANSGNTGKLALTYTDAIGSTIIKTYTVFNTYYSWSTSGQAGYYDVQNAATHEFGHWLKLNDLYGGVDTEKTMYGYISTGETKKRSLESDDLNGINTIYP
jgi:hypothetical protein